MCGPFFEHMLAIVSFWLHFYPFTDTHILILAFFDLLIPWNAYYSGASGEPVAKKAKVEDNVDGGMADIVKAKVTEVGLRIWFDFY